MNPVDIAYFEQKLEGGIEVKGGELHQQVDALEEMLIRNSDSGVFQRSGNLVTVSTVLHKPIKNVNRPDGIKIIALIKPSRLRELGTKYGKWKKFDGREKGFKNIDCPKEVALILFERNTWRFPVLTGLIGSPTLTPSGRIISKYGYDKASGLYLTCDNWPDIEERPTRDDAVVSLEIIRQVVNEFPFVDKAAEATWIAALFTALIRWSLRTAPFFAFEAPVMGAGKTLLATIISILASGSSPAVMTQPRDETELNKGLLAILIAGDPILVIDNVEHTLCSETLCTISTSPSFKGRLLGETKVVTTPTTVTMMITGNNLEIRGDLSTRILISRLDPGVEFPENRQFTQSNLLNYIYENRHKLVNAVLTILKAYHVAHRPVIDIKPFGRFEDWDAKVRSPLIWAGAADPCDTRIRIEQSDPEREQLEALLISWYQVYKDEEVLVSKMVQDVTSGETEEMEGLRDAIYSIAREGNKINPTRLGKRISKWNERVSDGLRITRGSVKHRARYWRLEVVGKVTSLGRNNATNTENSQVNSINQKEQPPDTHYSPSLVAAATKACLGLQVSPEYLLAKLSQEEISDFDTGRLTPKDLCIWAKQFDMELEEE